MSQSLWNRAVSYDKTIRFYLLQIKSLNPFGTGQCLTTPFSFTLTGLLQRLNPFGTGQCLTTTLLKQQISKTLVSIPLEQGSVLRHDEKQLVKYRLNVSIPLEQGSVLRRREH